MRFHHALLLLGALLVRAPDASAQGARDTTATRIGLWVIAPTERARSWASEWIEEALRTAPGRPAGAVADWREVLQRCLDVDASPLDTPPPDAAAAGGPAPGWDAQGAYPWDMIEPVPLSIRIERMREGALTTLVQVVASRMALDAGSRDSIWVLEAEVITVWTESGPLRKRVVLATSRRASHVALRTASHALGVQLAEAWMDTQAQRAVWTR